METNRLIIKFKNHYDIPDPGIKFHNKGIFSNPLFNHFEDIKLKSLYSKKWAINEYVKANNLPLQKSFDIGNEFYSDSLFYNFEPYEQEKSKVFILEAKNKADLESLYNKLIDSDLLEYVEVDSLIYYPKIENTEVYLAPEEYNTEALKKINAINCWDLATGKGINITVLDSGVNFSNEDLKDQLWRDQYGNFGRHFFENQSESFDITDFLGHGTKISGIIGAKINNEIGINGMACGSKIITVKLSNDSNSHFRKSAVCRAIDYAIQQNSKIISISWTSNSSPEYNLHTAEMINNAINKGIIVVCCTSNSEGNVEDHFPANMPQVITVGTVFQDNKIWGNTGNGIDIFALSDGWSSFDYISNSVISLPQATSWGPPQVCSLIAMMLEIIPNLSKDEILTYIQENAQTVNIESNKKQYPIKLINVIKTLEFVKNLKTNLKINNHEKQQLGSKFPYRRESLY